MQNETRVLSVSRVFPLRFVLPVIGYVLPVVISGPQWATGTMVNALLALYALKLSKRNAVIMCVLPSLGAVTHGVLLGTFTPFLAYFLPAIWAGNMLYVTLIRRLSTIHAMARIGISASAKAMMLFVVAFSFVQAGLVPQPFLIAMGAVQLATALAGGMIAVFINRKIT